MSRGRLPFLLLGAGGYGVGKSIEYHFNDGGNSDGSSNTGSTLLKTILDFVALSKSSGNNSEGSGNNSFAAIDKRLDELSQQVMYMSHSVGRYVPSSSGQDAYVYIGGTAISASLLYMYCRIKGIGYNDLVYVSKNMFEAAVTKLKSGIEEVSEKVKNLKDYFEQRILKVEAKVDESTEKLEKHIEKEVGKVGEDVEKVSQMQNHLKSMVGNLSDKVDQIEGQTRFSSRGIYLLCNVVSKNVSFASIDDKNKNEIEDLKEFAKLDPAQSDSLVHNNVQALRDICDSPSKASLSELMNGSINSIDCTPIKGHLFESLYYGLPLSGRGSIDGNLSPFVNNNNNNVIDNNTITTHGQHGEELKSNDVDDRNVTRMRGTRTPKRKKKKKLKPPGTV